MHSKALTSLRSFFRPILRFLGMSSSPPSPPEIEFPNYTDVGYWEVALLNCYYSRCSEEGTRNRSRMEALKVISIRRYKERRHVEHEYLIAEILDPDSAQRRYLQFKRSVRDPAHDIVSKKAGWPANTDIRLEVLDCRPSDMILLDLAIAAKVVHDHSDKYQVFKRRCFWYSDVIIGVLHDKFPATVRNRSSSLEVDHARHAEMEEYDKISGTFRRVPIYKRRMSLIEDIGYVFAEYRSDILSKVNFLNASVLYFFWLIITIDLESRRGC